MTPAASLPLVDLLLAVPGISDPDFRRSVYQKVPRAVIEQIRMDNRARIELIGLIDTFGDYPQLAPWQALLRGLQDLLPQHPAVRALADALATQGLIPGPAPSADH